jgi:predicted lipoprotein with Yx(FWY)xxD motif
VRTLAVTLLAAATAALAACGSSTSGNAPSGAAAASSSPTAAAPSPTAAGIVIATGTVSGVGTVLVDAGGHTLYHLTAEASGTIACTGACSTNWPPEVVPPGESVTPSGSLPGTFATVKRPDGTTQATYNGWPLYAFAGDTAAGTANGQGKLGKWFAVTPDLAAPGAAASPTM